MQYTIRIPSQCLPTLDWLAVRGYDGGFRRLAKLDNACDYDGCMVFEMTEPDAWQFSENVWSDPCAFLTCSTDERLNDSLVTFLNRIV
jgi:hypothetical protein